MILMSSSDEESVQSSCSQATIPTSNHCFISSATREKEKKSTPASSVTSKRRHLRAWKCPSTVRRHKPIDSYPSPSSGPKSKTEYLVKLQWRQQREHRNEGLLYRRRAVNSDVNRMLKWSFSNAIEWASTLDAFRRLSNESQKCVISEYGVAYFLVDQALKSVREGEPTAGGEFWFLQNGSYIHPDYFFGLLEVSKVDQEVVKNHRNFYETLAISLKNPFESMKIDDFEVATLKTLLLLTPSFPKEGLFVIYEGKVCVERRKCLIELMNYLRNKCPQTHEQRFGELILLIGPIRNAVKAVYNHTKLSDLFDSSMFDPYVQSFLLT